jgi:hypothetical protein
MLMIYWKNIQVCWLCIEGIKILKYVLKLLNLLKITYVYAKFQSFGVIVPSVVLSYIII